MSKLVVLQGPPGGTCFAQPVDLAADLGLPFTPGDITAARLADLLGRASALIVDYIGRPLLTSLFLETFTASADDIPPVFEWRRRNPVLVLSVLPVLEIESLTIRGVEFLPPEGFDLDHDSGVLRIPLSLAGWCGALQHMPPVGVTYRAGYVPPGYQFVGRPLPETIRTATLELASSIWQRTGANQRDPAVVREQVEAVGYTQYGPPPAVIGSMPADIAARLNAFRDVRV